MPEDEIRRIIDLTVKKSIQEYKRSGLLKDADNIAYADASALLTAFYAAGEGDAAIAYALAGVRFDPYFKIITLYFKDKRTIESIADELGVDISTIVRNKKRLCLAIYNEII